MIIQYIPAKQSTRKQRAAAYCRVSSYHENQEESFSVQKDYYTRYILNQKDWEFAGIYADEGISGTSVRKRPEFLHMIADAQAGKLDIILVKSISRFSRNAVECQQYVRLLREHHVQVQFEEEGINSLNPASDLIFNIRAAFAQEESRIIGENVRWTYRRNFEAGIYHIGSNRVLGYDEIDGELIPNSDAETVRMIFELFAGGASFRQIRCRLQESGARRLRSTRPFDASTLRRMLGNEIYAGDLFPLKSRPESDREEGIHYLYDHHAPIVSRDIWNRVQERLATTIKSGAVQNTEKSGL